MPDEPYQRTMNSFTDPISGRQVTLYIEGPDPSFFDGRSGVAHPGCNRLADVSPDLDAFYCQACAWNGRISGAWAVDVMRKLKKASRVGRG